MSVELVVLAGSDAGLSEREVAATELLLETCRQSLERRLPDSLELLFLDVGVQRRADCARKAQQAECQK